ncbi:hypothetical protein BDV95DRAFT_579869 [Massariosphaeria phaeospora]|uniref:Uncharacterized protein n=1 Tax=Massariosphaeria phaeospora TaxID=100035 RepID=A0A7C8I1M7_9PLEO|nr:hypothetical protein BDV95DRAFT_579869 [Massariosphaeria phaeospora]
MVAILNSMTRIIAGIPVPNTAMINASIALAEAELPYQGYSHVMRAWLNGQAMLNRLPPSNRSKIDHEAVGVATILHDLGWSNNTEIVSNDKTFEVDGAIAAAKFIRREGGAAWDDQRIQLVWDAIALHTNALIYPYKELEVQYTAAGTVTELLGPELAKQTLGDIVTATQADWDRIIAEIPRPPGRKKYFYDLMIGFCTTKPQVTYGTFQGDWGERYVKNYTRVGHRQIDLMDRILQD